ncbi:MAG: tetratricopeptide repeat protein [Endomicrobium sp.]|jgi:tetratricopeptide (TPR) repeat protein|nr:tetratricopeptide repeat protein [Endomicrobium sp.]
MKIEKRLFIKIVTFFMLLILLFLILFISIKNVRANSRAVKYFNKGNFEAAVQTFDNELKNNPKNYVVINNSAGADYKLNKLEEAKAKYSVIINSTDAAKEDKFTALYDTGNVEFLKNNFEKSVDFYREALKLNPNDKDAKYNLELALLKLNEKNSKQDKDSRDDKQKSDKQKQNQQAQDLKKQMKQNDKAQKENEKKRREENDKSRDNTDSSSQRGDNDKQKELELEREKKELDKQKQEISDKIKNLMNVQKEKDQPRKKQSDAQKEEKFQKDEQTDKSETIQQNNIKKDVNKDMQAVMLLNYYNEADKNSNKVINKNKEHLINQSQEDW